MLALALCISAVIYLYVRPGVRCCRKDRRPVSAELVNEYKDL